ncbi:MAG: hypothetical protein D9N13_14115 [Ketobacter sp. GenoA1]|nr:MAG: hypothetical protein D9N13_14115 [Ketobacter sp. GenoA1]
MKGNLVGVVVTWLSSVIYCLNYSFYSEYSYNTNYVSLGIASTALFTLWVVLKYTGLLHGLSPLKLAMILIVAYPMVYLGLVLAMAYLVVNDSYKMMNSISEARFITFHLALMVVLGFAVSNLISVFNRYRG